MGVCELCGKQTGIFTAIVEGSEVTVCKPCSKYGKIVRKPAQAKKVQEIKKQKAKEKPEIIEMIMPDYSQKIRKAREKSKLTQKEFAKKLNEKESIIQKIETGNFKPSLGMARKLERNLRIKLVETIEEKAAISDKKDRKELTIGDVIKIKHR